MLLTGRFSKTVYAAAVSAALLTGASLPAKSAYASSDVRVQINDRLISFPEAQPFLDEDQRLYVPIRFVAEQLGLDIDWEKTGKQQYEVKLAGPDTVIEWATGNNRPLVNGKPKSAGAKAKFLNGRVFMPFRFVAEATGNRVDWDAKSRTAIVSTDGGTYKAAAVPGPVLGPEMTFRATAYSASPEENGGWGAVDYFGNPLELGTIAVDPSVIPLGTKVYVTGYKHDGLPAGGFYAEARDIGGAIKGDRIDIFIPGPRSEAFKFGVQDVTLRIVK
ncbi:stalk domain-containing protein [Paenibacillus thermoaerophilus]|uniref:Stalk domain-containing protein n=1 Tax=Paenibacillus thermoaerophilus TaxID=1215385 RepID=A0ABW2UYG3_9BACL|nr:stalk domain-containing protein [Paenibacillus thermoaerophilus]TMV07399.1 hypothetical protein FE781_15765 [Paenibacillus thermoaerophilus]